MLSRSTCIATTREAAEEAAGEREAAAVAAAAAAAASGGIGRGRGGAGGGGAGGGGGGVAQRPVGFATAAEKAVGDMVRIVQLRSDYHPAILTTARPKQQATPVSGNGGGSQSLHRRAGSFMGL